jgi:hypothetical protein
MYEARKKMNKALTATVIPKLREIGFKGSFPHFRRVTQIEVHLITFQFDRNGGGFVIEIAKSPNQPFKTSWGAIIEPNKLTAHDLNKRTRIHPKGLLKNSATDDWFRYDKLQSLFGNKYSKVAKQVLKQIELIEELFKGDLEGE